MPTSGKVSPTFLGTGVSSLGPPGHPEIVGFCHQPGGVRKHLHPQAFPRGHPWAFPRGWLWHCPPCCLPAPSPRGPPAPAWTRQAQFDGPHSLSKVGGHHLDFVPTAAQRHICRCLRTLSGRSLCVTVSLSSLQRAELLV